MKIKKNSIIFYIYISLILILSSCDSHIKREKIEKESTAKSIEFVNIEPKKGWNFPGFDRHGYRYGISNLKFQSGKEISINWKIYQSSFKNATISVPSTWVMNPKKKAFLYFNLDTSSKDFFIWMKHSKTIPDLTLESFTEYVYNEVLSDTIEVCKNPKLQKYTFDKRIAYSFKCEINKKGTKYSIYSYFTEDEDYVYEFSIRFLSNNDDGTNKVLFDVIMDNIFIDKENIFGNNSPKIEYIDIGIK